MKTGGAPSVPAGPAAPSAFNPPTGPRGQSAFNGLREQADRERRERRAEPQVQDGRYGFDDRRDQAPQRSQRNDTRRTHNSRGGGSRRADDQNGLYSDEMMIDEPNPAPQGRRRGHR